MFKMKTLSVIIVNWNTKQLLGECIEPFYNSRPNFSFELIVVDNGSSDGSVDYIRNKFPEVVLIRNAQNCGFATAVNQGIKRSTGKFVLFLNTDCRVLDNALEKMVTYLEKNPQVGVLGPQLINSDGTLQPSGWRLPGFLEELANSSRTVRFFYPQSRYHDERDFNRVVEVEEVSGAALLTSKEIINQVGCLDDKYFFTYEDLDFCKRVQQEGFQVFYYPEAKIMHHSGKSVEKDREAFDAIVLESRFRYVGKFFGKPAEFMLKLTVLVENILRLLYLSLRFKLSKNKLSTIVRLIMLSLGIRSSLRIDK